MKKLYLYIIIILNWLNVCVANELLISANGIKLGDSALKYFDQNLIESKKRFIYKSDEYFMIYVQGEQNLIQFHLHLPLHVQLVTLAFPFLHIVHHFSKLPFQNEYRIFYEQNH